MNKAIFNKCLMAGLLLITLPTMAQNFSIDDFNKSLITNGVAWKPTLTTYLPAFYTGFAPRIEDANKIHFHLSRGNQVRLSTPLDDYSVLTYLYNLKARENLVDDAIAKEIIQLDQQNQHAMFKSVLNSSLYSIPQLLAQIDSNSISKEVFYAKSLETIEKLNAGRVYHIRLNFSSYAERWSQAANEFVSASLGNLDAFIGKSPEKTITLVNELLPGRINLFFVSPEVKVKLIETLNARGNTNFSAKAIELLNLATKNRYVFNVLRDGKLQPSLYQNASGQTVLEYPEFTAIYPNGSVKDYTKDRDGNQIPIIQENGLLNFVARDYHDVDHIRSEPYYGYAPKMDYTTTGNGIHNPAVRTYLKSSVYKNLYKDLNIPAEYNTLWIVSRGGVSHGCTRMASGHILEVRNIFPAAASELKKLNYFGNISQDYDLFDIDGNGQQEIMGVKYFLAYAIASDSGEGYREGAGLIEQSFDRDKFYSFLYGQNQFRIENGQYIFINPYISQFVKSKPTDQRGKAFSVKMNGEFALYEQDYEKDKMQFYAMSDSQMRALAESNDHTSLGKQLVRIFGRAAGCGPFKNEYSFCSENKFQEEYAKLIPSLSKVK
jgi:hypothetical protein